MIFSIVNEIKNQRNYTIFLNFIDQKLKLPSIFYDKDLMI
jgi:hypothetical protein